jgi:predicted transglutaminase-like cysteine proteinase
MVAFACWLSAAHANARLVAGEIAPPLPAWTEFCGRLPAECAVEAGLPRRALRMTVVIDEMEKGHAVLTVRTPSEDLILDNRTSAVLGWAQTGYTFVKRESAKAVRWEFLDREANDLSPVVAQASLTPNP